MDGGKDSLENCITLCTECHLEWHFAERITAVSFDDWMHTPTYRRSLAFWKTFVNADWEEVDQWQLSEMLPFLFSGRYISG